MTDLDDAELRALIDGSFGDGPTHRPLTDTLGAGRRAVRRRRAAVAGSTLAAVLALGGGALAVTGDGPTRSDDTTVPATQAPERTLTTTSGNVPRSELARITDVGSVELRDGVEVADWRDDPLQVPDPGWSVGLDLRHDGETVWLVLSTDGTGLRGGPSQASSFGAWVSATATQTSAAQTEDASKTEDYRDLVELAPDGEPVVLDEATLLDRIDGPGPRTVAVSVEYAGRVRWIAIQTLPGDNGDTQSTSMRFADEVPQWTFDEFVARTTGGRR